MQLLAKVFLGNNFDSFLLGRLQSFLQVLKNFFELFTPTEIKIALSRKTEDFEVFVKMYQLTSYC